MPKEKMVVEEGKLIISRFDDVQDVIDQNARDAADAPKWFGGPRWRHAGRIPAVVAEQWSKECGAAIGTAEFAEYIQKKLMDGDFARLRIKGF